MGYLIPYRLHQVAEDRPVPGLQERLDRRARHKDLVTKFGEFALIDHKPGNVEPHARSLVLVQICGDGQQLRIQFWRCSLIEAGKANPRVLARGHLIDIDRTNLSFLDELVFTRHNLHDGFTGRDDTADRVDGELMHIVSRAWAKNFVAAALFRRLDSMKSNVFPNLSTAR